VPVVCRYKAKRSRQRVYTRSDAARIVCYALEQQIASKNIVPDEAVESVSLKRIGGRTTVRSGFFGSTGVFDRDLQQIIADVETRCGAKGKPSRASASAAAAANVQLENEEDILSGAGAVAAMQSAQQDIDQNQILWQSILEWTLIIIGLLSTINTLAKFIPGPLRLVAAPLPLVIRRAAGFQGAIIARKAANDRLWAQLARQIELLSKKAA